MRLDQGIPTRIVGLLILGALTGCGSLPSSGPSISMIQSGAEDKSKANPYVLVPVTQDVVDIMRKATSDESQSGNIPSPTVEMEGGLKVNSHTGVDQLGNAIIPKIAAGDILGVSIYTSGGGLFGSSESSSATGSDTSPSSTASQTTLPPQLVDNSGAITVPYAGRIPVVGHTPNEVENEIIEGLKGKAFMLSVIVTLQARNGSDLVTMGGDLKSPGRVAIPMSGLRVVDAISACGGITGKDYETYVVVVRGQNIREDNYRNITVDPQKNIYLQAGDTVLVKVKPWSYATMGAMGQTLHPFSAETLTAAEAVAGVSGLNDQKANPEAVFIYRFESPALIDRLGVGHSAVTAYGVPVIYQLNFRDAGGFFMAKQFAIRDKDVIFVGNAGTVGVIKAMQIAGTLISPAISGASAASDVGRLP